MGALLRAFGQRLRYGPTVERYRVVGTRIGGREIGVYDSFVIYAVESRREVVEILDEIEYMLVPVLKFDSLVTRGFRVGSAA